MLFALFSWSDRMGRLAYFGYTSALGAILGVLGLILLLPLRNAENGKAMGIIIVILLVAMALWGGFCLMAKRLHDLDMSAWHYAWIVMVPAFFHGLGVALLGTDMKFPGLLAITAGSVISLGVTLFLMFWRGTDGTNQYGERPL